MNAVTRVSLPGIKPFRSGKVREMFDLGDRILMVATDRISAFDVVLPIGIPDRGMVLNQLSAFWFERLVSIVQHHMISMDDSEVRNALGGAYDTEQLRGRSMIVQKCEPILLECVARGYIEGSLYKEYMEAGGFESGVTLHGISLAKGLQRGGRLPNTIFTPATKAQEGHDENIDMTEAGKIVGEDLAGQLMRTTIELYNAASELCGDAGIILADTKFEFGRCNGDVILIDESLTPDSSRFWPADEYEPGRAQKSFDKQFIRDYLEESDWDKTPPAPQLPESVVRETRARYIEIFRRLTGQDPVL